jgi:sugar lactone lactonase YvrE
LRIVGIQIFSDAGQFLAYAVPDSVMHRCSGIAFDTNGEVFLSDCDHGRILVCHRSNGMYIRQFALPPPPPKKTDENKNLDRDYMIQLAVDGKGHVFVADFGYHRVFVLRRDGAIEREFGTCGENDGQFMYPSGIAVNDHGHIIVCDQGLNQRVQVFVWINFAPLGVVRTL